MDAHTSGPFRKLLNASQTPSEPQLHPKLTISDHFLGAQEEILILDWWLSPELYLRRPPSLNEKYRLDNMLKAAAERGVKVNVIVYREVEAALTCNSQV